MNELPAISAHILAAIADFLEAPQYQVALWDSRLVDYFHSHPFEQLQGPGTRNSPPGCRR